LITHAASYNPDRNIAPGNPYKTLVADLMKRGVQIELAKAAYRSEATREAARH